MTEGEKKPVKKENFIVWVSCDVWWERDNKGRGGEKRDIEREKVGNRGRKREEGGIEREKVGPKHTRTKIEVSALTKC